LRAIRIRMRLRQQDLAAAAGVSRSMISRLERGQADGIPVGIVRRTFTALGGNLVLMPVWRGAALDRLMDERHALLSGLVLGHLERAGWSVAPEVSFAHYGERGSVDLLAGHPPTRTALVTEVKTELGSIEETQRRLDVKVRLCADMVQDRFGWRPLIRARLLVLPEGRATRTLLERHAALLGAAYPQRGWVVRRWIRAPSGGLSGLWVLSKGHLVSGMRLSPEPQRVRAPRPRSAAAAQVTGTSIQRSQGSRGAR
jgi:hypothetical protein